MWATPASGMDCAMCTRHLAATRDVRNSAPHGREPESFVSGRAFGGPPPVAFLGTAAWRDAAAAATARPTPVM
jgi:hypothetical protein